MTKKYDELVVELKKRLPATEVTALAKAVEFIRRVRAIRASLFVWAVVLSRFAPGRPGFAEARECYKRLGGQGIWPRPFQKRFLSAASVALFEQAFLKAVESWRNLTPPVKHPLARRFADVVIWDSTVLQLSDKLAKAFKGINTAKSSLKVSLAISAFGLLPLFGRVGRANQVDYQIFPPLEQFKTGTLWLFDKGFLVFERLRAINKAGQFFLCPMKRSGNGRVLRVRQGPARAQATLRATPLQQWTLRRELPAKARIRQAWDIDIMLWPKPTTAQDKSGVPVRLVILPGPRGEQRPYLTNLPAGQWPPKVLRELYRVRWQVELVFKELKQHLNLRSVPSANRHAVQVFAWASLIALAISRTVATFLNPWPRLAGLASPIRPCLVSRALRATVRVLFQVLTAPARLKPLWLQIFTVEILNEVRSRETRREDSFRRLTSLLAATP